MKALILAALAVAVNHAGSSTATRARMDPHRGMAVRPLRPDHHLDRWRHGRELRGHRRLVQQQLHVPPRTAVLQRQPLHCDRPTVRLWRAPAPQGQLKDPRCNEMNPEDRKSMRVTSMKTSEQISELAAALAAAQGMMDNAVMNRVNPHFKSKYADLAAIFDAARKPLSANGLAIVQTIGDGVLHTRLLHTSGQWIASEHPLPMSGRPQEIGSALTYARRYSLSALIGIAADEDDDANAAAEKRTRPTAQAAEKLTEEQIAELDYGAIKISGRTDEWFCKFAQITELERPCPRAVSTPRSPTSRNCRRWSHPMSQCERCKCFPNRYFEEHSISEVGSMVPRTFCPTCVICVAGGYLAKAQLRKVQEAQRKARRPHKAPEATQ